MLTWRYLPDSPVRGDDLVLPQDAVAGHAIHARLVGQALRGRYPVAGLLGLPVGHRVADGRRSWFRLRSDLVVLTGRAGRVGRAWAAALGLACTADGTGRASAGLTE